MSPSLTHSYWRNCSFVSSAHQQPAFVACQTKPALNKHLITACRDSQDWHLQQSLNCSHSPAIWAEVRHEETETRKKIWLILRHPLSHVSVQVIPNLSQFASKGADSAHTLCRLTVITDGISVRVWMWWISGFRLSQTPVAVLKMRVATSQTDRCGQQRM